MLTVDCFFVLGCAFFCRCCRLLPTVDCRLFCFFVFFLFWLSVFLVAVFFFWLLSLSFVVLFRRGGHMLVSERAPAASDFVWCSVASRCVFV